MAQRMTDDPVDDSPRWIEYLPVDEIVEQVDNPKGHDDALIAASFDRFGYVEAMTLDERTGRLVAGHGRLAEARRRAAEGADPPDGIVVRDGRWYAPVQRGWTSTDDDEARAYVITSNRSVERGGWRTDVLAADLLTLRDLPGGTGLDGVGYTPDDLDALLASLTPLPENTSREETTGALLRFVVPPVSILDTRQGYWQDRKRRWLTVGIRSELGRGDNLPGGGGGEDGVQPGQRPFEAIPGGSRLPAATRGPDGKTVRGDSRGRPVGGMRSDAGRGNLGGKARSIHADEWAAGVRSRRDQDRASNVTGAPRLPDWADNSTEHMAPGTSIFDPVLCEVAYRWFSPTGATVLDPFAGGSVRGIVAACLGRDYVGVDLSTAQVEANRAQAGLVIGIGGPPGVPTWHVGDSRTLPDLLPADVAADLVFTCPPYYDLEVYSDDPADLSCADDYPTFLDAYRQIIAAAVDRLRPDRFACVVVSEVRGPDGTYLGLVPDTIRAFVDAGCALYNEMILINAYGSLPLRVARPFRASRKVGRTHQNVLVFVKGDPGRATAYCGPIELPLEPEANGG